MKTLLLYACAIMLLGIQFGCSSSSGGTDAFMKAHDYNADGKVSRDEYHRAFDDIDYNGDAIIDDAEIGSVLSGH